MPFIGLQVREGEHRSPVLHAFMLAAQKAGSSFRILKLLGPMDLGRALFLRFETDCNRRLARIAAESLGRGHIIEVEGAYVATFEGWSGPVSAAGMQEVSRPGWRQTYKGPGTPFWERQFSGSTV